MAPSTATTDAAVATSALARPFTRVLGRGLAVDAGLLGALTVVIGLVYFLTGAPLYNDSGSVDAWVYTALWTNFDQMYHHFITTYYASRAPWIAPGYAVNAVLGYRVAYFVLHIVSFCGGALLLYVFCRRWLGRWAAALAYAALIANPLYWAAHRWNYENGALLTYMIATIAFLAPPRKTSNRWRLWSLGLSGFFAAATIGTRLFEVLYLLLGVPLLYWATVPRSGRRELVRRIAADAGAFAAGAALLLLVGGVFTWATGGDFFFLKSQIDITLAGTNAGENKIPVHVWLPVEPYFFVAPFVGLLGWLTLRLARPERPNTRRVLVASATWCLLQFAAFALWEFASTGWIFEYAFYWSSFLPAVLICLAATATALLESGAARRHYRLLTVALGTTAVVVPLAWIYGADSLRWVANGIGHGTYLATLIVMAAALLLVGVWRIVRAPSLVVAATVTALFAFAFGTSTSLGVFVEASRDPNAGNMYTLGQKLIGHLHELGYTAPDQVPYFWINTADPVSSLQALYFWDYTQIGSAMPTVDQEMRQRMSLFKPKRLILLCSDEPTCHRARRALAAAGYPSLLWTTASYRSGGLKLDIVELALPQFDPILSFYSSHNELAVPPRGTVVQQTRFARHLPKGWTTTSSAPVRGDTAGLPYLTSNRPGGPALAGPSLLLPAGKYVFSLRGRVLRGGLTLGVLNEQRGKFAAWSNYWSGQRGFDRRTMVTTLNLRHPLHVRVVLTNWVPQPARSRWLIRQLEIRRVGTS